jgi:hypothetical protein
MTKYDKRQEAALRRTGNNRGISVARDKRFTFIWRVQSQEAARSPRGEVRVRDDTNKRHMLSRSIAETPSI